MSYFVSAADADKIVLSESDTVRSVLQNIKIILATQRLTVPLYREFGMEMRFVDKPIPVARSMIVMDIKEAIARWEPRAEFISVQFEGDESAPGKLIPIVEVEIADEQ